jgi:hypothetical protein
MDRGRDVGYHHQPTVWRADEGRDETLNVGSVFNEGGHGLDPE